MADKKRPLHILKSLWDHADEKYPLIITDILAHIEECGIQTNRKAVASDLEDLLVGGFDVVCNKSRQNKYFIENRSFELAEQLKRRPHVEDKDKTTDETINYTVDLFQTTIQTQKATELQYIEYTPKKEKVLKYDGYVYRFTLYPNNEILTINTFRT